VSWAERFWRWCRRKPTAAGLLAALLALVLLAVGGGLWSEGQKAERQGRAREAVEAALGQLPDLRRQGRWAEAEAVLTQARSRLDEARSDDLRLRLAQAEEALQRAAELERLRLSPATEAGRFDYRSMTAAYARAFGQARGQLDEAMAEYRRAIEFDPKGAPAHHNLGLCLQARGQLDEAMAQYRGAIELDPKGAPAHFGLGLCLQARGQLDEAMAQYCRAIELNPERAPAHYQLGMCWHARGQLDEAIAEFRRSIQLDPKGGLGHEHLAETLLRGGRFAEARTAVRRALDMLPGKDFRRPALQEKLKVCERLLALDARLPALLQGKERPAVEEQLQLARLCRDHGRPHPAVSLYAAAFAARPALADDLGSGNRYNAACAAARAAASQGPAKGRPGAPERADKRRQALAWLRADLELRTRLLNEGKGACGSLAAWQTDSDLDSVRAPAELAKLPAAERAQWRRLWADVTALLSTDPLWQGLTQAARRQWAQAAACYA
jgi:tetratricopeptide (TPR) repeat protein